MGTPAAHPFWLDGGYDREEVEGCEYHPFHHFRVFRLGDLIREPRDPEERMVLCIGCFVPRCGDSAELDPCVLPRHHEEDHLTFRGVAWPVGGTRPELAKKLSKKKKKKG